MKKQTWILPVGVEVLQILLTFTNIFKWKDCETLIKQVTFEGQKIIGIILIFKSKLLGLSLFDKSLFLVSLKIPSTMNISQHSTEKDVLCSLHVCISAYQSTKYWHDNCSQAWMNSGLWEFSWCCTNWMAAQDTVWNARCKLALYSAQAGII